MESACWAGQDGVQTSLARPHAACAPSLACNTATCHCRLGRSALPFVMRLVATAKEAVQAAVLRPCNCYSLLARWPGAPKARQPPLQPRLPGQARWSSSNSRWKQRQGVDFYARQARVQAFKSRAAFKLLEMDKKYNLFRRGHTVVDLGYAPGSWSQVALDRTKPNGKVVGIDIIPAQPPRGVSTIQGNFLSPGVQMIVKDYLLEIAKRGSPGHDGYTQGQSLPSPPETTAVGNDMSTEDADLSPSTQPTTIVDRPSYIDTERSESIDNDASEPISEEQARLVDVVLSDMSAPWYQTSGFSSKILSNPYNYNRMMNTSGMTFRDHAGSMDLCNAALSFASDTLRAGGHFVCKFYQGAEDKELENRLKKMFWKVSREKPDSSRPESREAYFVALRRKGDVTLSSID
ncbi:21S rRNA (uridine2791-2'-O)-methyltransferase [Microdochium nivale]|nr:21S rRNA (uridine2791-2'-O)-methyltransferase [Microdochium nivale]